MNQNSILLVTLFVIVMATFAMSAPRKNFMNIHFAYFWDRKVNFCFYCQSILSFLQKLLSDPHNKVYPKMVKSTPTFDFASHSAGNDKVTHWIAVMNGN
jgi:hypothetical protein